MLTHKISKFLFLLAILFSTSYFLFIKPAKSAVSGQIMVDPNNESWFVYNRDSNSDGKKDPFFMCGAGEPEEFLYTEGTSYVQANDVINKISGTGANAVYFQLIRTGGDIRSGQPDKQDPFVGSSCDANTNLIGQWKSKWFNKMDQLGITMYIFFYDDGVSKCKNEESFFRDVVNQLEGYKNLIWVVAEEYSEGLSTSDVNRIAGWIRKYDDNNHPVGNHQLQGTSFDTPELDTFAIQYNSSGIHSAMVSAFNKSSGRYNIVMSESKASFGMGTDQLRRFHWGIVMGGAYITELDWWYHGSTGRTPSTAKLQNCGNIVRFMEQTTFNEMSPNDSLRSGDTDYVLANPGSSYIAYTDSYSSGIGLQGLQGGSYNFLWYDIINNRYTTQNNVNVSSGTQKWSRPSGITGNEVVVYLTNRGVINTPSPTSPSPTPPDYAPGDANGDGNVDYQDYIIWIFNYGKTTGSGASNGDFDTNGVVDGIDFSIWRRNYSGVVSTSTPTSTNIPTQPPNGNGISPIKVATGAYPAVTVDSSNNVHLAYARSGILWYKKYTYSTGSWSSEQNTGITQYASYRNDPDIVVDSQARPHVIGGQGNGGGKYAYWDGSQWVQTGTFNRDTALTIDNNDNVYVVERGGHSGGFIGVSKRSSGSFSALPDPPVNTENDHVYSDIFASQADNSVHIVYRHGIPTKCAYTYSTNEGSSWSGGGISGDDAEAPNVTVSRSGTVYSICGSGGAYQKTGNPSSWSSLGTAVGAGSRRLPVLTTDSYNNLYASSFGGKYNIRVGNSWIGEKAVSGISSRSKGFMRTAGASYGQYTFAVWEEGNSNPENDNSSDQFDIVFATINSQGTVGSY